MALTSQHLTPILQLLVSLPPGFNAPACSWSRRSFSCLRRATSSSKSGRIITGQQNRPRGYIQLLGMHDSPFFSRSLSASRRLRSSRHHSWAPISAVFSSASNRRRSTSAVRALFSATIPSIWSKHLFPVLRHFHCALQELHILKQATVHIHFE